MKRNQKQPWNETFSDVRDSSGHLSRTKLHRQNHNNNVITIILVVIIGLIAVFALIYGLASNTFGHDSTTHRAATSISRVSHKPHHHKHHVKAKKERHKDDESGSNSTVNESSISHHSDNATSVNDSSHANSSTSDSSHSNKQSSSSSTPSKASSNSLKDQNHLTQSPTSKPQGRALNNVKK